MGEAAAVRAFAAGRANARWSPGAGWVIGIFVAAFVVALVLLHAVLLPGVLVLYVLYDTMKPRRGVAVTVTGVAELKLSMMSGRPSSVLATTNHAALFQPHIERGNGNTGVRLGAEDVALRDRDLRMLQGAIPIAVPQTAQPDSRMLPLPPPPQPVGRVPDSPLPGWRETTVLWILAHVCISLGLLIAVLAVSNGMAYAFGRDTNQTDASADVYLLGILGGTVAGWMLFVYWRGAFRIRMLLLGALAGGALLLACIVNVLYSPPVVH
jgi:hypothetical protein